MTARPDRVVLFHYNEITRRLSRGDGGVYSRSRMSIGKSARKQYVTVGFEIRKNSREFYQISRSRKY